MRVNI